MRFARVCLFRLVLGSPARLLLRSKLISFKTSCAFCFVFLQKYPHCSESLSTDVCFHQLHFGGHSQESPLQAPASHHLLCLKTFLYFHQSTGFTATFFLFESALDSRDVTEKHWSCLIEMESTYFWFYCTNCQGVALLCFKLDY